MNAGLRGCTTSTPWGRADYSKRYAVGVMFYGTPGHGGFHLSPKREAKVDPRWRKVGRWYTPLGWYEEDCEWCVVALTFPELFSAEEVKAAHDTAKRYYPEQYNEIIGAKS